MRQWIEHFILEMLRKDLRGKSLPLNRSRRAKPAVSELFQALNAKEKGSSAIHHAKK
jgi:hypothetical protein